MLGAKRKRVSRACDRCHKLGRKCVPSPTSVCQTCTDYGDECTYERPMGKRGAKPKAQRGAAAAVDKGDTPTPPSGADLPPGLTHEGILQLLEVYRLTAYPIYCFFSWSHFAADVAAAQYEHNVAFRTTVIAVCAIAAARIRDGACDAHLLASLSQTDNAHSAQPTLDISTLGVSPEVLRSAALAAVPSLASMGASPPPEFEDLRAMALLAVLGVQNGDPAQLNPLLGRYLALVAMTGFHDESRWPQELADWEVQERRALYWGVYTLDVFTASIWGGTVRHQMGRVAYPHFLDAGSGPVDPNNDPSAVLRIPSPTHGSGWIQGWNVVTDLYRALHAVMTQALQGGGTPSLPGVLSQPPFAMREAWPAIKARYDNLPGLFKKVPPITGIMARDIYSFQAANLAVTLQALRMGMACAGQLSAADRCAIAGELLDALAKIPTGYMHAISAPLLHQLAGVGSLLGSVVHGPLTLSSYINARQILLTYGHLLSSLETSLAPRPKRDPIASKILHHVSRIDAHMASAAGGGGEAVAAALGALPPYRAPPDQRLSDAFPPFLPSSAERTGWPHRDEVPIDPALEGGLVSFGRGVDLERLGIQGEVAETVVCVPEVGWPWEEGGALWDLFRAA